MTETEKEKLPMINEELIKALTPICPNVYPDVYTGTQTEYIVFLYDIRPVNFGDDYPFNVTYDVRVHYLAPLKKNVIETRLEIIKAIANIDFATYPEETNATDDEGQHFVYDFEMQGDSV